MTGRNGAVPSCRREIPTKSPIRLCSGRLTRRLPGPGRGRSTAAGGTPARTGLARVQVVTADQCAHLLVLEAGQWNLEASYD